MKNTVLLCGVAVACGFIAACVGPSPIPCTQCGDQCVDLKTDERNCGGCGTTCSPGSVCADGICSLVCPTGLTSCGSNCLDVRSDPANCGRCGVACARGEFCAAGSCTSTCPAPLTVCGDTCVDTQTSATACGNCMTQCSAQEFCQGGTCARRCAAPLTQCGTECVDPRSDSRFCGNCTTACAAGEVCSAGRCSGTCGPGLTVCAQPNGPAQCINTENDPSNCGGCNQQCSLGAGVSSVACQARRCAVTACQPGLANLDGDPTNGCEAPATNGLLLWVNAQSLSVDAGDLDSDGGVVAWRDLSGSSRNLAPVPPEVDRRPTLIAADPEINNQPTVSFDGVDDLLMTPRSSVFDTPSSELSVIAVFKPLDLTRQQFLLSHPELPANSCGNFELGYRTGAATRANFGVHRGCTNAFVTAADLTSTYAIVSSVFRGAGAAAQAFTVLRNGTSEPMTQDGAGWFAPGSYPTSGFYEWVIGGRHEPGVQFDAHARMRLAELLVYSRVLSAVERSNLETSLATKYGLMRRAELSGEVEWLNPGSTLILANGSELLTVSSDGPFTFAQPLSGAYGVTVASQPPGQTCTVTNGNGVSTSRVTNVLVRCSPFVFKRVRAPTTADATTLSSTFVEMPDLGAVRFRTTRADETALLTLTVPYLGGPSDGTAASFFGDAIVGIEVDGTVLDEATFQSANWGQGGPATVTTLARLAPGTHTVRPVWRRGRVWGTPTALPIRLIGGPMQAAHLRTIFTGTVLDSLPTYHSSREARGVPSVTASAAFVPLAMPPLTWTSPMNEKTIVGLRAPDPSSPSNVALRLTVDGVTVSSNNFQHSYSKKPVFPTVVVASPTGPHVASADWRTTGTAARLTTAPSAFQVAFDGATPSASVSSTANAPSTAVGVDAVIPGLTTTLTLANAGPVLLMLNVNAAYSNSNGGTGLVSLEVDGTPVAGTQSQSQNNSVSVPVNIITVETLTAGTHTIRGTYRNVAGGYLLDGNNNLHAIVLNP